MWYGKDDDNEPAPSRRSSESANDSMTSGWCGEHSESGRVERHRNPEGKGHGRHEGEGCLSNFSENLAKVKITKRQTGVSMEDRLLDEAAKLIKWAEQNISGPSKLNDELQDWLKTYNKYH